MYRSPKEFIVLTNNLKKEEIRLSKEADHRISDITFTFIFTVYLSLLN